MVRSHHAVVNLRGEPEGDLEVSWAEEPGARPRTIARAEVLRLRQLAEAVSDAERLRQGDAIHKTRRELSTALRALVDGPERAFAQRIESAESAGLRLDVVVRALAQDRRRLGEHAASWMRWELLPYAETINRGAPPCTVVLQLGARNP